MRSEPDGSCRRDRVRRHLSAAGFCGVLLFGLVVPAAVSADKALDDYNLAVGLYKQDRWKLASDSFRKFIKGSPRHAKTPFARLYLGLALVNQKKHGEARQVLRGFVRSYPKSKNLSDALYRVGECSYLLDDLKAAEGELGAFLKSYPKHELAEWGLPYLADVKLRLRPIAPRTARSPDRGSPVDLAEETAACCLCLDDFSRPDNVRRSS